MGSQHERRLLPCRQVQQRHYMPLASLQGVGPKTISCVLLFGLGVSELNNILLGFDGGEAVLPCRDDSCMTRPTQ